ncbi:hypothetical protein, partial [Rubrivirga sp.]|uniref:hypothetical protein n=1 Tax=Rubrivirga sp. TaxID=1885344 RepID=UPI003C7429C0
MVLTPALLPRFAALLVFFPAAALAQQASPSLPPQFGEDVAAEVQRLLETQGVPPVPVVLYRGAIEEGGGVAVAFSDPLLLGVDGEDVVLRPDALVRDLSALREALSPELGLESLVILAHPDVVSLPGAGARAAAAGAEAGYGSVRLLPATTTPAFDDADAVYI